MVVEGLDVLARFAVFVFSLVLLALLEYLLFYFKRSVFGRAIRVVGASVLFLAASATVALLASLGLLDPAAAEPSAQALLILFLITSAYALSLLKDAFERVEWLREQWIHELEERWARERTRRA